VTREATVLTTYFEERDRSGQQFQADVLFDLYARHRVRTSALLRGVLGFGQRHELHSDRLLTLSESLPAVSIAVDTAEQIETLLPEILEVTHHGMVSLERCLLLGEPVVSLEADTVKLTVYGGRGVRFRGQAGYVAAIDRLRAAGVASASVLLGVDGTLHGERQRARFFARNATVPLVLSAVGAQAQVIGALPDVIELVSEPVTTLERVTICKLRGVTLAPPAALRSRDRSGLPIRQKITVQVEESARIDGRPVYLELVRRLRRRGASGVTVLRGVRGFYGDLTPFSDRMLALRRNVPVHVIAVDDPESVRRWWPVVDELTRASGLVTSEIVPAAHALAHGRAGDLPLAAIDSDP
jgi:PII-like signaling protein